MKRKSPAEIYNQIQASTPTGLDNRVLAAINPHRGKENAISRRRLIVAVFGGPLPADYDLSKSVYDRQLRKSVARLQEHFPILSSSGEGGYYLPESREEVTRFAAEIVSRAKKLEAKARRLEQLAVAEFGSQLQLF